MRELTVPLPEATRLSRGMLAHLWTEMRPAQWAKNLTILAPLLFAQQLFVPLALGRALAVFVLFCLLSSAVYLFNDFLDYEQDRVHPEKRHRPLAAGHLTRGTVVGTAGVLLVFVFSGALLFGRSVLLILVGYWLLNLLYSLWLKHQVILDVFSIAAGFVLRVVGGAVAVQVEISHWLLICTTLLALFLGFCKRRHEVLSLGAEADQHRQVLTEYNPRFLDMMIGIVTAATVMSYALYTVSEETVRKFHTEGMLTTLPFVLYGIFRYLYLVYHKELGGDPTQQILTDIPLILNLGLWTLTVGIILYWR
jgi:4-hydroxybenzoate polyprenyltransferase